MASHDITQLPGCQAAKDVTTLLAAGSATITSAQIFKDGANTVIQLNLSAGGPAYIKIKSGQRIFVGGADNTIATGTEVIWTN